MSRIPRSGIRAISDLAWSRTDVIRLELGEPDFPTPPHVCEAATLALREGRTKYTPNTGIPALREALADSLTERLSIPIGHDDVVVTHGAVSAILASLSAVLSPGDGVLSPTPAWPNFAMMLSAIGADEQRYGLTRDSGYLPDVDELRRLVRPNTRALLLNSPSNPLGSVIPEQLMQQLVSFAQQHQLWVISDECYDQIVFDDTYCSPLRMDPNRVVAIYSFSKTYAMTGWRVGYAVLPEMLRVPVSTFLELSISCANAPAQWAALAALTGPQDGVIERLDTYRHRRDRAVEHLTSRGIAAARPSGGFYLWIDTSSLGMPSLELARQLLTHSGVALAPGSAFGPLGDDSVRVSLASNEGDLLTGLTRLASFYATRLEILNTGGRSAADADYHHGGATH